jgi:hypothetical protein
MTTHSFAVILLCPNSFLLYLDILSASAFCAILVYIYIAWLCLPIRSHKT